MRGTRATIALLVVVFAGSAHADTPLAQRVTWSGGVDFFATGAPIAIDGNDTGPEVDQIVSPATVTVSTASVPNSSTLVQGFLYWSGSINNTDCTAATNIDDRVMFRPPGAAAATEVIASVCYCSDAGATSYDVQVCRADVTNVIAASTTTLAGAYSVEGFAAKISNASTDNASFSLVLVFEDAALPPRRIALYDGVLTMSSAVNQTAQFSLANLDVDNPAQGDLTWYALEGDVGGTGTERVTVSGSPGGASLVVSDAVNPANNPMNHTINTVSPANTTSIGVDIDRFDISAALTAGDTAVNMLYEAGTDKWWIAYNIVGVNVFEAALGAGSTKTSALQIDADGNGVVSVGDTVRYTIALRNTGTAPGVVDVVDTIPAQAASWTLVSAGGGTPASTATTLIVNNVPVAVGGTANVVFDVVIANVPDNTMMTNTASFDATPDGDAGTVVAAPVLIRRDQDTDTVFDTGDNCPTVANMTQTNSDGDALGDACDACPMDATNDADADTICQNVDNCPGVANMAQTNADADSLGDACDTCPMDATNDADADTICQNVDNCPGVANMTQTNTDADSLGDACDACVQDAMNDVDGDTVCGNADNCPSVANTSQLDTDADGDGDACDACAQDAMNDIDGDTVCGNADNCPAHANSSQADGDGDGQGDACDACVQDATNDPDGDGVCEDIDNCPMLANASQGDADGDGAGDDCDPCDEGDAQDCAPGVPDSGCCSSSNEAAPSALLWLVVGIVVTRRRRTRH